MTTVYHYAQDGNVERAVDWVLTELAAMEMDQPSEVGPTYHDGPGSKPSHVPVLCIPFCYTYHAMM